MNLLTLYKTTVVPELLEIIPDVGRQSRPPRMHSMPETNEMIRCFYLASVAQTLVY